MLAKLIDMKFDSRKDFAELMTVSDDKVSNWCRGLTRLRGKERVKAAKLLDVSEDLLKSHPSDFTGTSEPPRTNVGPEIKVARAGFRFIPIYGSLPAGSPSTSYSQAIDVLEEADWGSSFDRWGRPIEGDSMKDDLDEFLSGDVIIFENRQHKNGHAVHARKDGEDVFKILHKLEHGRCEFMPLNAAFPTFDGKDWEILGVAIERRRDMGQGVEDIRKYKNGYIHRF